MISMKIFTHLYTLEDLKGQNYISSDKSKSKTKKHPQINPKTQNNTTL
jgi:hypothetical protein